MRALLFSLLLASTAVAQSAPSTPPAVGGAKFRVLLAGNAIGTAESSLNRTAQGWSIQGLGHLGAPLDLDVRRIDVEYAEDWTLRSATLDLATASESVVVHAGFVTGSDARIDIVRDGRQVVFVTADVSADALILPNLAFSAYEALAVRLGTASPGTTLKVYVLPQREIPIRVESVADETLRGPGRPVRTRRWRVTFVDPAGPVSADVWVEGQRLVRFDLPAERLSVVRDDVGPR